MRVDPDLIPAVPRYVGNRFEDTPPGHRFRLYFQFWDRGWNPVRQAKLDVMKTVVSYPQSVMKQLESLLERQKILGKTMGVTRFEAELNSPLTTGLGIEHPTENGFAFLDPYGLPYLPGSSVKGVVRRAAEELALFEPNPKGWTIPAVWWLFGFDSSSAYLEDAKEPMAIQKDRWRKALIERTASDDPLLKEFLDAVRPQLPREASRSPGEFIHKLQSSRELRKAIHIKGALDFWDVLPRPSNEELRVDIMNPHYVHYYQQDQYQQRQPPGDWGNPTPIFFLTFPEGTGFVFHVRLLRRDLPRWLLEEEKGSARWKTLLEAAMFFAFEWLGFGAKTAVGYGRLNRKADAEEGAIRREESPRVLSPPPSPPEESLIPQSPLSSIESRIRDFPSGKDPARELDELVNLLGRNYKDPLAPTLASELWAKVKDKPYGRKLQKNRIVWDLIEKGGGS